MLRFLKASSLERLVCVEKIRLQADMLAQALKVLILVEEFALSYCTENLKNQTRRKMSSKTSSTNSGARAKQAKSLADQFSDRTSHAAESNSAVRFSSALQSSLNENQFLQASNAQLLSLQAYQVMVNIALLLVTTFAVAMLLARTTQNAYFLVDQDGRVLTQIDVLKDPVQSSNNARSFADECVRKVLNIDFVHYKRQLSDAETCFTRKGFVQVVGLMQKQGILAEISKGYSVASALPKQANFLKASGTKRGKQRWRVKGSYIWSLQQGTKTTQYPLEIEVSLVEVGINQNVRGMAIDMLKITRG